MGEPMRVLKVPVAVATLVAFTATISVATVTQTLKAGATTTCNSESAPTTWTVTDDHYGLWNATNFNSGSVPEYWYEFEGLWPNDTDPTTNRQPAEIDLSNDSYAAYLNQDDPMLTNVIDTGGLGLNAAFKIIHGGNGFEWCERYTDDSAFDTATGVLYTTNDTVNTEIDNVEDYAGTNALNDHWTSSTGKYGDGEECPTSGGIADCQASFPISVSTENWNLFASTWTSAALRLWMNGTQFSWSDDVVKDSTCGNYVYGGADAGYTEPCVPDTTASLAWDAQQNSVNGTGTTSDNTDLAWESSFYTNICPPECVDTGPQVEANPDLDPMHSIPRL